MLPESEITLGMKSGPATPCSGNPGEAAAGLAVSIGCRRLRALRSGCTVSFLRCYSLPSVACGFIDVAGREFHNSDPPPVETT